MGWIGEFGAGAWRRSFPSDPDDERRSHHGLWRSRGQQRGRRGERTPGRRDQDGVEMTVLVGALVRNQSKPFGPMRSGRARRMVMRLAPVVVLALALVMRQVLVDQ